MLMDDMTAIRKGDATLSIKLSKRGRPMIVFEIGDASWSIVSGDNPLYKVLGNTRVWRGYQEIVETKREDLGLSNEDLEILNDLATIFALEGLVYFNIPLVRKLFPENMLRYLLAKFLLLQVYTIEKEIEPTLANKTLLLIYLLQIEPDRFNNTLREKFNQMLNKMYIGFVNHDSGSVSSKLKEIKDIVKQVIPNEEIDKTKELFEQEIASGTYEESIEDE
jgi:hypothetical protein